MDSIKLGVTTYPVQPPASFAEREDAVVAWVEAGKSQAKIRRVYGAMIGLCCPSIAKAAGVDWRACEYDAAKFGTPIYDHLRGKGVSIVEIATAAGALLGVCLETRSPREDEVANQADFTEASAAPSIAGS
jgi:hypothetical protein